MAKKKLTNKARQGMVLWSFNNAKDRVPVSRLLRRYEFVEMDDALYMPQITEMIRRKLLFEQEVTPAPKRTYTKKEPVVEVLDLEDTD